MGMSKRAASRGVGAKERGTNRLAGEKSPYLLQHADNPVDWYPWGEEAFERARREDRPVFLSIGYSTCHWCHVMAHESFEDPAVARMMNDDFISIKVDREERPDIDGIYMTVCQMMTGSGGWPLTIVMTPDKRPFFAGTYFPKESRFGRAGLTQLLPQMAKVWRERRGEVNESAEQIQGLTVDGDMRLSERIGSLVNDHGRVSRPGADGFLARTHGLTNHTRPTGDHQETDGGMAHEVLGAVNGRFDGIDLADNLIGVTVYHQDGAFVDPTEQETVSRHETEGVGLRSEAQGHRQRVGCAVDDRDRPAARIRAVDAVIVRAIGEGSGISADRY